MTKLVCLFCGGVLEFGADGWQHRDAFRPCERVAVAWPPPDESPDDASPTATG